MVDGYRADPVNELQSSDEAVVPQGTTEQLELDGVGVGEIHGGIPETTEAFLGMIQNFRGTVSVAIPIGPLLHLPVRSATKLEQVQCVLLFPNGVIQTTVLFLKGNQVIGRNLIQRYLRLEKHSVRLRCHRIWVGQYGFMLRNWMKNHDGALMYLIHPDVAGVQKKMDFSCADLLYCRII